MKYPPETWSYTRNSAIVSFDRLLPFVDATYSARFSFLLVVQKVTIPTIGGDRTPGVFSRNTQVP